MCDSFQDGCLVTNVSLNSCCKLLYTALWNRISLTLSGCSDKPFVRVGSEEHWDFTSASGWLTSGTNSFCRGTNSRWSASHMNNLRELSGVMWHYYPSHLTRVDAASKQLVQLNQFVWGDVELERDAVEGIVWSHLWQETDSIETTAHDAIGDMSKRVVGILTMNSTVPGGLLFSLLAWLLLLETSSERDTQKKKGMLQMESQDWNEMIEVIE